MSKEENHETNNVDSNEALIEEIQKDKKKADKKSFFGHFAARIRKNGFGVFKKGFGGLLDEYHDYKDKKGEIIGKYEAYETVVAGSTDTIEYYVLLILSCLIATFGLFQDSPAVIIGAMIVAPLMGPLFGFSAGVLWGSGKVLREAVFTLFKGVILVLAVTAALSFFIPGTTFTNEMLTRCRPSLFDIMIAICCGLVGAYAYVNKRISTAIPGVAISVALMPPLCTMGICIGLQRWDLLIGSSTLFVINLISISISALVVFYFVRLHPQADDSAEFGKAKIRALSQFIISFLILIVISIPLVFYMMSTFQENIFKEQIYSIIKGNIGESKIYHYQVLHPSENMVEVDLVLLSDPGNLDTNSLNSLQNKLEMDIHIPVKLSLYAINRWVNPENPESPEPPDGGTGSKGP
ncbi:MAG: TIGR00341 family protein [Spirochaetales bacterium]|nr:TIGR00341 family protein [Spirochaetales bacterium]